MQKLRALLLALASISLALSGCTSGGNAASGFSVPKPDATGAYTFKADVTADNYTWDLGDHLSVAHGKTVTHTYDFKNGNITVTLKTRTGTETASYHHSLVVGSGLNQPAVFLMEAQTDWAVTGQTLKFSASLSHDADGDPLRYSWSCLRTADAARVAPHYHPPSGASQPFATAPAGSVTAAKSSRVMPTADTTFTGDLCQALGAGSPVSTHIGTIQGSFATPGKYTIYLLASDPVHPTVSGSFNLIVTPPGDRPDPVKVSYFAGTFKGGANGDAQAVCDQASQGLCDFFKGSFNLPLNGMGGNVTVRYDAGPVPGAPTNKISWSITRGTAAIASGTGASNPETVELNAAQLVLTTYTLDVKLDQGRDCAWNVTVMIPLNMDPTNVY